jgi:hypothetical protein
MFDLDTMLLSGIQNTFLDNEPCSFEFFDRSLLDYGYNTASLANFREELDFSQVG